VRCTYLRPKNSNAAVRGQRGNDTLYGLRRRRKTDRLSSTYVFVDGREISSGAVDTGASATWSGAEVAARLSLFTRESS